MLVNYIIWTGLFLFFITIIGNYSLNRNKEGAGPSAALAEVYSVTSTTANGLTEVYSVVCKDSPTSVEKTKSDELITEAGNDYVSTVSPPLIQYITKLQEISDKFNNISTALSIGTIDISAPQTKPIVIITPPIDDKIEQKLNFILPKGNKGKSGSKPNLSISGPNGIEGPMGKQGVDGTYAIIEQQKKVK